MEFWLAGVLLMLLMLLLWRMAIRGGHLMKGNLCVFVCVFVVVCLMGVRRFPHGMFATGCCRSFKDISTKILMTWLNRCMTAFPNPTPTSIRRIPNRVTVAFD